MSGFIAKFKIEYIDGSNDILHRVFYNDNFLEPDERIIRLAIKLKKISFVKSVKYIPKNRYEWIHV